MKLLSWGAVLVLVLMAVGPSIALAQLDASVDAPPPVGPTPADAAQASAATPLHDPHPSDAGTAASNAVIAGGSSPQGGVGIDAALQALADAAVEGPPSATAPPDAASAAATASEPGQGDAGTTGEAPPERAPQTDPADEPARSAAPVHPETLSGELADELADVLPQLPEGAAGGVFGLVLLLLIVAFLTVLVNRAREGLPRVGFIPRTMAVLSGSLKLAAFGIGLLIVTRLIPEWMDPIFRWILLAAAAALGWSARDVLPDLLAGVIITLERRVRPGVWLSGDGFSGLVESRGPRAVWIRDTHGHLVSVPNRILLNRPTFTDTGIGVGHEITLRLQTRAPAALVRQALHDAVLMSPWVPPTVSPLVLRDTAEPDRWHLRCRLLEPGHALHFEGQLLERAEEIIGHLEAELTPEDL